MWHFCFSLMMWHGSDFDMWHCAFSEMMLFSLLLLFPHANSLSLSFRFLRGLDRCCCHVLRWPATSLLCRTFLPSAAICRTDLQSVQSAPPRVCQLYLHLTCTLQQPCRTCTRCAPLCRTCSSSQQPWALPIPTKRGLPLLYCLQNNTHTRKRIENTVA